MRMLVTWAGKWLRLVVWFVAGAHGAEIRSLVSYRWCDGLIFVAGLAAGGVHIIRLFLARCSWNHCLLCLDSVSAAYWLRIERSQICHKWDPRNDPHTQIFSFQVTHRLKYSFLWWPKLLQNTMQSLLIVAVCEKLDCLSSAYRTRS